MPVGRRRKTGPRYPSGKLKPDAETLAKRMTPRKAETCDPTPETLAHRQIAFGASKGHGQLNRVLDHLRGRLSDDQYWAGDIACCTYERYCAAIKAPRVVAGTMRDYVQGGGGEPMDHEAAMEAVKRYTEMVTAVRRYSFRSLKEIERVMHGSRPRSWDSFSAGLTALSEHLGYEQQKAA